jgi:hypothetical protein
MVKNWIWDRLHIIKRILIVAVILIIVCIPIFAYFRISSSAHIALREAKNVKLTMEMLDIEYYGQGSSVYDGDRKNGLKKGVEDEIWNMLEHGGDVVLQSYNKKKRKITGFTYANQHYQVIYNYDDENGDSWQVRYFINIID